MSSLTKKVVNDERYRLWFDVIGADICLKSWLQQSLVDSSAAWKGMATVPSSGFDDLANDEAFIEYHVAAFAAL